MQITHDPKANIAYIRFRDRQGEVETLRITSDFLVDVDATGAVCGVELLNANEQLIAEARLAAFDRDGLSHTLDALRQWSAARATDPTAPCPPPTTLR